MRSRVTARRHVFADKIRALAVKLATCQRVWRFRINAGTREKSHGIAARGKGRFLFFFSGFFFINFPAEIFIKIVSRSEYRVMGV